MGDNSEYIKLQNYLSMMDNSLQSYRMIFITSISILFLIAVSFIQLKIKNENIFIFFLYLMNIFIIVLWRKVCTGKVIALLYFQIQLLKLEKNKSLQSEIFNSYKTKLKQKKLFKDEISNTEEYALLKSDSIILVMEILMPWFFVILWSTLLLYMVYF